MERSPVLGIRKLFKETLRTKSGMVGFGILAVLILMAAFVPFVASGDVSKTWGSIEAWSDYPRNAAPEWTELFAGKKLPRTMILEKEEFRKAASDPSLPLKVILLRGPMVFPYDDFPSELFLTFYANWTDRPPVIEVTWERPDGLLFVMMTYVPERRDFQANVLSLSVDPIFIENVRAWGLSRNATDSSVILPEVTLFAADGPTMLTPTAASVLKGQYQLRVKVIAFLQTDDVDARLSVQGKVFGLAGTDARRRDLMVGLLWGAPVALAFGVVAALLTVFGSVFIGALGAYYGGRSDEIVQRATDILIIIPILPILILMGTLYRPGLVTILAVVVLLSILGGATKVARSIVLQVKEEQYVEAAKSYGASRGRILLRHIIPRVLPYTFALIALSVPAFIFLEASLSFLGLGDPFLPTWGAIMGDAQREGALYNGLWWWIAFPAIGILAVTVAFALIGYSFDKILNPRLREE